jgi:hypothetical protein
MKIPRDPVTLQVGFNTPWKDLSTWEEELDLVLPTWKYVHRDNGLLLREPTFFGPSSIEFVKTKRRNDILIYEMTETQHPWMWYTFTLYFGANDVDIGHREFPPCSVIRFFFGGGEFHVQDIRQWRGIQG